jgi:hypothetical protein
MIFTRFYRDCLHIYEGSKNASFNREDNPMKKNTDQKNLFVPLEENHQDLPEYWTPLHDISLIKIQFTPKHPAYKSVKEKFVFYYDVPSTDFRFRGEQLGKKYGKEEKQKILFDEVAMVLAKAGSVDDHQRLVERSHQRLIEFFLGGELNRKSWKKILSEMATMNSIGDFYNPDQKAKMRELLSFWTEQSIDLSEELKTLDGTPRSMRYWKQREQQY